VGGRYLTPARPVLLDTCAAIWLVNGDPIAAESSASITAAQAGNLSVYVSPMTAWEIPTLAAKNQLHLTLSPDAWFDALLALAGVRLAATPPRVLIASTMLPGEPPKDPVDRIIAATGRAFGYTIITRDGDLMLYARAGHIEAIGC
jgi:PIN domain nuclease of toxin-antitoxin system